MALNKAQTSLVSKIIIVMFGLALIIGLAGPSIAGLTSCGTETTEPVSVESALEDIAGRYRPVAESWEGMLVSDPESATILLALGNLHSDWTFDILVAADSGSVTPESATGPSELAASYYERAVRAGATEPGVRTDLAIAYFYSNRTEDAIATIEEVVAEYPEFAAAYFNGGIFLDAAGRADDSVVYFQRYLELDPEGTAGNPEAAQSWIAELSGATPAP